MSDFRDALLQAASARIAQPAEESHRALCVALESYLRTCEVPTAPRPGDPMPGECDGVVLLEDVGGGGPISEFLGYSWLVTSQQVTPLRARFWMGPERLEFEVRFGIADLCVPQDELDRLWRRGRFPEWSDEWAVLLRE